MAPLSARYVLEAPLAVVPARAAALLESWLRLDEARIRLRGRDAQVDEVLASLHVLAVQYQPPASSPKGTGEPPSGEQAAQSDGGGMSTVEVAVLAGCTPRAVRMAVERGLLDGLQVAGRWRFRRTDVNAWLTARAP